MADAQNEDETRSEEPPFRKEEVTKKELTGSEEVQMETGKSSRNLYELLSDAIQGSVWMYLMADLREMAHEKALEVPDRDTEEAVERLLNLPCTSQDMATVLKRNLEHLEGYLGAYKDLYLSGVEKWKARNAKALKSGHIPKPATIVEYNDVNQASECVYGIVNATAVQKIIVVFRGSVTTKDWLMNLQAVIRDVPNPVEEEGQPEFVGIHHGFRDYLYGQLEDGSTKFTSSGDVKGRRPARRAPLKNQCQKILGQVAELLEENPGYQLEVYGHSLGGALGSLVAFEAAASADPRIPRPVTCVSIGAPKAGNMAYRFAVEALERQQKLRMIRVENQGDAVPLVPDLALNMYKKSVVNMSYRHVGMKLYLLPAWRNSYHLYHPTSGDKGQCQLHMRMLSRRVRHCLSLAVCTPLLCITCCKPAHVALQAHGCLEYMHRLDHYKKSLEEKYLHDLYDEFLETKNWKQSAVLHFGN